MGNGVKKKKKAGPGRPPVPRSKRDKAQHRRDGRASKQAASKNRASEILIKQGIVLTGRPGVMSTHPRRRGPFASSDDDGGQPPKKRRSKDLRATAEEELAIKKFLAVTAEFSGDAAPAAELTVAGQSAEVAEPNGETALWVAAENGDLSGARAALERGADVNSADFQGQTPLWAAAYRGQLAMLRFLSDEASAAVNRPSTNGKTPLWVAAYKGQVAAVRFLAVEAGADPNLADSNGETPLWVAARHGHEDVVRVLVTEAGADITVRDKHRRAPLQIAASKGHAAVVRLLAGRPEANVDAADSRGETLLFAAATDGDDRMVRMLVSEARANVDKADGKGVTPLAAAAKRGHHHVVQFLAKGGAGVNLADEEGSTAMFWAARAGHATVVQVLIDWGNTDVNLANKRGQSPLLVAAQRDHLHVVQKLTNTVDGTATSTLFWTTIRALFSSVQPTRTVQRALPGAHLLNRMLIAACDPIRCGAPSGNALQPDIRGATPLDVAARKSTTTMLRTMAFNIALGLEDVHEALVEANAELTAAQSVIAGLRRDLAEAKRITEVEVLNVDTGEVELRSRAPAEVIDANKRKAAASAKREEEHRGAVTRIKHGCFEHIFEPFFSHAVLSSTPMHPTHARATCSASQPVGC